MLFSVEASFCSEVDACISFVSNTWSGIEFHSCCSNGANRESDYGWISLDENSCPLVRKVICALKFDSVHRNGRIGIELHFWCSSDFGCSKSEGGINTGIPQHIVIRRSHARSKSARG